MVPVLVGRYRGRNYIYSTVGTGTGYIPVISWRKNTLFDSGDLKPEPEIVYYNSDSTTTLHGRTEQNKKVWILERKLWHGYIRSPSVLISIKGNDFKCDWFDMTFLMIQRPVVCATFDPALSFQIHKKTSQQWDPQCSAIWLGLSPLWTGDKPTPPPPPCRNPSLPPSLPPLSSGESAGIVGMVVSDAAAAD